jgi:hypothetical protein
MHTLRDYQKYISLASIFYRKKKLIYALLKVQLQLFPAFTRQFVFIDEHLSKKQFLILLFINIIKRKETTYNTLCTDQLTHIEPLTTNKPSKDLRLLLMCTN